MKKIVSFLYVSVIYTPPPPIPKPFLRPWFTMSELPLQIGETTSYYGLYYKIDVLQNR